jgi:hypothetical protein
MSVVDGSFDHPLKPEEHATMYLAGGLLQNGYQCGMLWGAALAAGTQAYRLFGTGPLAEAAAIIAAQRLVAAFRARTKHIDCGDITNIDWKATTQRRMLMQVARYFAKGGPLLCFGTTASYAQAAYGEIVSAYARPPADAPSTPVSCAAALARKLGRPAQQAVMVAGLAGGIGLSGGACGALGAAVWFLALNRGPAGDGADSMTLTLPGSEALVERFLERSGYEFECAKIAGRTFESADDHARYVREGGCAAVLEALAIQ